MADQSIQRYLALDILQIQRDTGKTECGILLEVWNSGALIQTSYPYSAACPLTVSFEGGDIPAIVESCQQDDYGYVVQVAMESATEWFPATYQPNYLLPVTSPLTAAASTGSSR